MKLPESRLEFDDDWFYRYNEDGTPSGQHALKDVRSVSVVYRLNVPSAWLLVLTPCLAYAAIVHMPWTWLGWMTAIVLMMFEVFVSIDVIERRLQLVMEHGRVRYKLSDDAQVCNGFIMTLRDRLGERA